LPQFLLTHEEYLTLRIPAMRNFIFKQGANISSLRQGSLATDTDLEFSQEKIMTQGDEEAEDQAAAGPLWKRLPWKEIIIISVFLVLLVILVLFEVGVFDKKDPNKK